MPEPRRYNTAVDSLSISATLHYTSEYSGVTLTDRIGNYNGSLENGASPNITKWVIKNE